MTRVSSYGLYECDKCGQVHVKPQYSSVSVYVPWDLNIAGDSLLTCAKCGDKKEFSKFKYLGICEKEDLPLPAWLTGRKLTLMEKIFGEKGSSDLRLAAEPPYPHLKK